MFEQEKYSILQKPDHDFFNAVYTENTLIIRIWEC